MQGLPEFLLFDIALLGLPLAYLRFIEKKKLGFGSIANEFGLGKGDFKKDAILTSKIFACLIIFSIIISFGLWALKIADFGPVQDTIYSISGLHIAFIAYLFIVRVFAEELFFRAFLAPRTGVAISSLLFGLMHLSYGSVSEFIGAIALGAILGIAFMEKRRLLPNFAAHALYNLAVFIVVLVPL